jgi:type VI protein secretion system component Hcp
MSKANDNSKLEHRELTDTELDAVTGGATPKLYEAACKGTHLPEVVIEMSGGLSLGQTAMMGARSGASGAV